MKVQLIIQVVVAIAHKSDFQHIWTPGDPPKGYSTSGDVHNRFDRLNFDRFVGSSLSQHVSITIRKYPSHIHLPPDWWLPEIRCAFFRKYYATTCNLYTPPKTLVLPALTSLTLNRSEMVDPYVFPCIWKHRTLRTLRLLTIPVIPIGTGVKMPWQSQHHHLYISWP